MSRYYSVDELFNFSQDYIVSYIKRSAGIYFVHCIQPLSVVDERMRPDELLNIHYVRNQLRYLSLVDAARAASQGVLLFSIHDYVCYRMKPHLLVDILFFLRFVTLP